MRNLRNLRNLRIPGALILGMAGLVAVTGSAEGAQVSNAPSVWDGVTARTGVTTAGAEIIAQSDFYRFDCLFINTSSHTEYIDFGTTAGLTSIPISPGSTFNCAHSNIVETDYISLYDAVANDKYYILSTYARGQ